MEQLPEDPAKQWEILLCIVAFEEKKKNRRADGSLDNLAYFWKHAGIRHIFGEWLTQMVNKYDCQRSGDASSIKNNEISLVWRKRGNIWYKAGNCMESLKCYTKSVLFAKKSGPMYCLALANRSAAAVKLGKYKAALTDIHRALCNGYPLEMQHKLFLRRTQCFAEMGDRQGALEAIDLAIKHNHRVRLSGPLQEDFERQISELHEAIGKCPLAMVPDDYTLPQLYHGENPDFRGASIAVDIQNNEEYGRHVVANRPVKRGDVLFAERPFAAVTLSEKHLPHPNYCDYCCSCDEPVIGCDYCSEAVFCGETCVFLSDVTYHRWECPGVRAKIFNVIGISHLALRVLIQYANRGFPTLPESFGSPTTAAELLEGYEQVGKTNPFNKDISSFYSMFHLSSNVDKAPVTDNIQYALTASMLTQYLEKYTSFFDFFSEKVAYALPPDEMKLFATAIIFRTLGQLVINAHSILDVNAMQPASEVSPGDYVNCFAKVGTAIYPAASMMNHSCDPNIVSVFYKNQLLVKGYKEIAAGAQVFNCYGPHYAREAVQIRKEKLLTQYGFNCACEACSDDSRKDFTSLFVAFACPSCKGPVTWVGNKNACHQCPYEFPLQRAQATADAANMLYETALRARTQEQQCDIMARAYRLMQQVLYRHHNALRRTVHDLANLYADNGDYVRAVELMKQNVQSYEYQFGSFSVEVTNEIRQMSGLMLSRIVRYMHVLDAEERQSSNIEEWCRETLNVVKKATQLMELHFGTWRPAYSLLKNNEAMLEGIVTAPRVHGTMDCFNFKLQMNI